MAHQLGVNHLDHFLELVDGGIPPTAPHTRKQLRISELPVFILIVEGEHVLTPLDLLLVHDVQPKVSNQR